MQTAKRRRQIRIISYTAASLVISVALAITGWAAAERWRTRLENTYQRAWAELSEYLADMEATLNKVLYTNSLPEQTVLSAELLRDAGCAQNALSALPMNEEPIREVYRFLAQAGEFAQALTVQRASGVEPDEVSANALQALFQYANELNVALQDYQRQAAPSFTSEPLAMQASDAPSITDGFRSAADELEAYPTLIYDGAFADQAEQAVPQLTEGLRDYGVHVARQSAVDFQRLGNLGSGEEWTEEASIDGNLPCYVFRSGTQRAEVTRAGAYLVQYRDERPVGESRISAEQAVSNACVFLTAEGYSEMQPCYYEVSGGTATILFAAEENRVRCYPDQIKVHVALDNGGIVGFNCTGYLMHHTERTIPAAGLSAAEAQRKLSARLTVAETDIPIVVIPTVGGSEAVCYEFACTGIRGETVLVYLDITDGRERSILIRMDSENGAFVM